MRLTIKEQVTIRELTEKYFGKGSTVRLFGSRVDDSKRGGDIDLYIEPVKTSKKNSYLKAKLWANLQLELGEQKIDIVIANNEPLDIDNEALSKGVLLNG